MTARFVRPSHLSFVSNPLCLLHSTVSLASFGAWSPVDQCKLHKMVTFSTNVFVPLKEAQAAVLRLLFARATNNARVERKFTHRYGPWLDPRAFSWCSLRWPLAWAIHIRIENSFPSVTQHIQQRPTRQLDIFAITS